MTIKSKRGQGMTEYIIIVALIAIASIGVVMLFGDNVRALYVAAVDALAGKEDVAVNTRAADIPIHKSLKDFANNTP